MARHGHNAAGGNSSARSGRAAAKSNCDAASRSGANGAVAYADRDSHTCDGSSIARCDHTITDEGGVAGVIVRIGGRARGG